MIMRKRLGTIVLMVMVILGLLTVPVIAAEYPTKPINLIVVAPAGGSFDVIGRAFASVAEKLLGQPVVVLNKVGASGLVGTIAAVQSPPDGYNLLLDASNTASLIGWEVANNRKPPFVLDDLIPLGSFTFSSPLVIVSYNSPWKTLADMVRDCKAKPDFYAFCSSGMYGGTHLPAEVLMRATGITARHVPSEGAQCYNAVVGGHIDFSTQWPSTCIPLVRGNKLRVLAVMGEKRLKSIPDVPTAKEQGVDAEWYQWTGISAPKKTPNAIIERLKDVAKKVAVDKTFVGLIENQGDEVRFKDSDELLKFRVVEAERLTQLVKQLLEQKK
jgi:tripartite-type tricarboxylate transporter receptor subunit TctC